MVVPQNRRWFYLISGVIALCLGLWIYSSVRGANTPVNRLLSLSGIGEVNFHDTAISHVLTNNSVLLWSLPDGLWMYSAMSIQLWIWKGVINRKSGVCMVLAYLFCIGHEVMQGLGLVPGTFDKTDLIFMIIGGQLPVIIHYIIHMKIK